MKLLARIAGRLAEVDVPAGAAAVPTAVLGSDTYSVPADTQALFTMDIDVAGVIDVAGTLVEV